MSDDELWKRLEGATDSMRPEILQQLGWRCIRRDDYGLAIQLLEEAKAGYDKMGSSTDACLCEHWIARCHANLGELDVSIAHHAEVIRRKCEEGPLDELGAKTLDAIGCEYRDSGRYLQAAEYFGQAARTHHSNGSDEFAENSARKWMDAIVQTGTWQDMPEASGLVTEHGSSIEARIHVIVCQVRAQLACPSLGYDIDDLLASADRLDSCQTDVQCTLNIELVRIEVMLSRGQHAAARERAAHGRQAAIEMDEPNLQAQFLLALAESQMESEPQAARELLMVAQDLGQAIKDTAIIDHAATSLMQLREAQLAQPQMTLWEAAGDPDA